jgi:hypothetical protein
MWDALKRFLGVRRGEEATRQEMLAKMGIFLVKDERVEQRVKELADFYAYRDAIVSLKEKAEADLITPEECLSSLIANMNMLNKQIDRIATPYWRALSDRNAGIVMRAWSEIVGYFFDVSYTLLNWFKRLQAAESQMQNNSEGNQLSSQLLPIRPRLPKSVLISAFLTMVIREYLPRAETLVRVSWTETDVTPSWAGAIQPVIQPQIGYGIPPIRQYDTGSPAEQQQSQPYISSSSPDIIRHRKEVENE